MDTDPFAAGSARPRPTTGVRDAGLIRVRRLTKGAAAATAGALVVVTGYVAHALPGRHLSAATTVQPAPPTTSPPTTTAPAPDPGSGSLAPPTTPPTSPPTTAPQRSFSPQVVSGSS